MMFIQRLKKFNLEVAEKKTKIIQLKKGNDENVDKDGNFFDFLGLTHYVGKDKNGRKRIKGKLARRSIELVYQGVKNG